MNHCSVLGESYERSVNFLVGLQHEQVRVAVTPLHATVTDTPRHAMPMPCPPRIVSSNPVRPPSRVGGREAYA